MINNKNYNFKNNMKGTIKNPIKKEINTKPLNHKNYLFKIIKKPVCNYMQRNNLGSIPSKYDSSTFRFQNNSKEYSNSTLNYDKKIKTIYILMTYLQKSIFHGIILIQVE